MGRLHDEALQVSVQCSIAWGDHLHGACIHDKCTQLRPTSLLPLLRRTIFLMAAGMPPIRQAQSYIHISPSLHDRNMYRKDSDDVIYACITWLLSKTYTKRLGLKWVLPPRMLSQPGGKRQGSLLVTSGTAARWLARSTCQDWCNLVGRAVVSSWE